MKIILIIVAVFYTLKLLTRYLGPLLLRYLSKKMVSKFESQFQQQSPYQNTENQNNTHKTNSKINKSNNNVGEYVDFEEID